MDQAYKVKQKSEQNNTTAQNRYFWIHANSRSAALPSVDLHNSAGSTPLSNLKPGSYPDNNIPEDSGFWNIEQLRPETILTPLLNSHQLNTRVTAVHCTIDEVATLISGSHTEEAILNSTHFGRYSSGSGQYGYNPDRSDGGARVHSRRCKNGQFHPGKCCNSAPRPRSLSSR